MTKIKEIDLRLAHWDGAYTTPDGKERSYFTLHIYLNDATNQPDGQKLVGGATTFWMRNSNRRFDVHPKIGSVLIFQHSHLLHSGDDVNGVIDDKRCVVVINSLIHGFMRYMGLKSTSADHDLGKENLKKSSLVHAIG